MPNSLGPRLRWFVAGGIIATGVDIGLYVALRSIAPDTWSVIAAGVLTLVAASLVSYGLHRLMWLRRDPFVRWMHNPGLFVGVAIVAGMADLIILVLIDNGEAAPSVGHLLTAKLGALAVAAVVRATAYRTVLFRVVRAEQNSPSNRPTSEGKPGTDIWLSVVVPAYREADRIAATIETIADELPGAEIVVVDDGSGDETANIAERAGAVVVRLPENKGKGGAVRAGVAEASGRTIAFLDADLAYRPALLNDLVAEVEGGWDVVVGNRKHVSTTTLVQAGRLREIGGRLVNFATHALLLGQYRDTQCGVKAFRADVARLLFRLGKIEGFAFDVELFHLVERYRLSLHEVPVTVVNSDRSTVKLVADTRRLVADLFRIRRFAARGVYDADPSTIDLPPPGTEHQGSAADRY